MTAPSRFRRVRFARPARHPKLWLAHYGSRVPAYVTRVIALLIAEDRAERSLR